MADPNNITLHDRVKKARQAEANMVQLMKQYHHDASLVKAQLSLLLRTFTKMCFTLEEEGNRPKRDQLRKIQSRLLDLTGARKNGSLAQNLEDMMQTQQVMVTTAGKVKYALSLTRQEMVVLLKWEDMPLPEGDEDDWDHYRAMAMDYWETLELKAQVVGDLIPVYRRKLEKDRKALAEVCALLGIESDANGLYPKAGGHAKEDVLKYLEVVEEGKSLDRIEHLIPSIPLFIPPSRR